MGYRELKLNPKGIKTGDCAIRAVAAALSASWDNAYKQLADAGFRLKVSMSETEAVESVLLNNGFSIGKIKVPRGSHRPTVASFTREHPDWVSVLRVANHLVACSNGIYVDIWDSGECSVYKYWYKEIRH